MSVPGWLHCVLPSLWDHIPHPGVEVEEMHPRGHSDSLGFNPPPIMSHQGGQSRIVTSQGYTALGSPAATTVVNSCLVSQLTGCPAGDVVTGEQRTAWAMPI